MIKPPVGDPSSDELADWAELEVIFGSGRALSRSEALRVFADEYGDDATDEPDLEETLLVEESGSLDEDTVYVDELREAAAEGLSAGERRWEALLAVLNFRAQVVGRAYPLAIEPDAVLAAWHWEDEPVYAFLAMLGARLKYGLGSQIAVHAPAKLFEQVVAIALGEYLGGVGYRFGWPRLDEEPAEDLPTKVRRLARRMGEHVGAMRNVGPDDKDHKLDVIAWRSLDDGTPEDPTPGQAVIVCQCGIGADWNDKVLVARMWEAIINFAVTPIAALAFPLAPSRDDDALHVWHDIASAGSIPFDRLRIASLIDPASVGDSLRGDVVDWISGAHGHLPRA